MIMPDWYWVHGLHDAKILSVVQKDIPWDPMLCYGVLCSFKPEGLFIVLFKTR